MAGFYVPSANKPVVRLPGVQEQTIPLDEIDSGQTIMVYGGQEAEVIGVVRTKLEVAELYTINIQTHQPIICHGVQRIMVNGYASRAKDLTVGVFAKAPDSTHRITQLAYQQMNDVTLYSLILGAEPVFYFVNGVPVLSVIPEPAY